MLTAALGGLVGGVVGALFVVGITSILKGGMDFVSAQATWVLVVAPVVGLALAMLVLQGIGRTERAADATAPRRAGAWRTFPRNAVRADITAEVVDTAGVEERFRWRLVPIRVLAILATIGSGGAMGTEAPAAYLGLGAGAGVCDRGRWRKFLLPAAVAGGAAGVASLMGIALVGTFYMLELGRRHRAPLSAERMVAALVGGLIGWGANIALHVNVIRLIVPEQPPSDLPQAVKTALFIGLLSGALTALGGVAIYQAKKWRAAPHVRLVFGGLAAALTVIALLIVAGPAAAVGPGGGAILWAEDSGALPPALLAVAILRALATTSAAAAGGCGGVFVPFLAIGDIGGRVFAPGLDVGNDLAGAAGAAAGIAAGYRLPLTAVAMVLGLGGPRVATLTCLATVAVAAVAGWAAGKTVDRVSKLPYLWKRRERVSVSP